MEQQQQQRQLESLGRAVEELQALEAIWGPEGFVIHTDAELALAQAALDLGRPPSADWQAPRLGIELRVAIETGISSEPAADRSMARLRCGLPPGYPLEAAQVSVGVDGLTRANQDQLTSTLQAKANEVAGEEAVMELVQELQDMLPPILADQLAAVVAASARPSSGDSLAVRPQLGRRWIVSHHLKNPTKRSNIVAWAKELSLGGYSKPGYPGCIVVEGQSSACDEYFQRLRTKTGNWKNLVLRTDCIISAFRYARSDTVSSHAAHCSHVGGEIDVELPADADTSTDFGCAGEIDKMRKLPREFRELTEDMGEFAALAKACRLGQEFMECVMQHRAGGAAVEGGDLDSSGHQPD